MNPNSGRARLAGAVLGFALSCSGLFAQGISSGGPYSLAGHIVGGGGQSSSGAFAVTGEVGRAITGVSSGGGFTVVSGISESYIIPFGEFEVEISVTGTLIRVSWTSEASGYRLEFAPALDSKPNWQPVTPAPSQNFYTIQATQAARFFRLHRP